MAYDTLLAERVRRAAGVLRGVTEKQMFGGLAFLLEGKMFVGLVGNELMVRVGPERHEEATALPGVRTMDFTGRPMKGYVFVAPARLAEDAELERWVTWSSGFVATLPAKAAARAAPPRRAGGAAPAGGKRGTAEGGAAKGAAARGAAARGSAAKSSAARGSAVRRGATKASENRKPAARAARPATR